MAISMTYPKMNAVLYSAISGENHKRVLDVFEVLRSSLEMHA